MELLIEAAKPMIEVMVSRVTEEIGLFTGYKKELGKVQEKIQIIGSIVLNMSSTNEIAVETWLRKIFPIIHDVENLLDVLAYEKQRAVFIRKKKNRRSLIALPLERFALNRKIRKWIKKINGEIKEALEYANTINSLNNLARSASLQVRRKNVEDELQQLRRNVDTSLFVGRDSDVASLVEVLCNPSKACYNFNRNRLNVVAIVGLGGIGKTSLALQVYENEQVKSYFSERIWITVSQDFSIDENLNKMVEYLKRSHDEKASSETSIRNLEEHLAGKRYLLVMDDVWNINLQIWDAMRNALERAGGSMDSMILATTRDNVVAETIMSALRVQHLSELSKDDGWSLFEQIAFANRSQDDAFILKSIGEKIFQKCKGVPLAIKTVAGILKTKSRINEWKDIEKSALWELHDDIGILPSLKLSYNHLPSAFIKKCFSICAYLPKSYYFPKHQLIDRWNALGLTQQSNGRTLAEDIGEEYFNVLVSVSFVLVFERNELGEPTHYNLHDLVYDLATSVAQHDRVYLEVDKKENNVLDIQHLTVIGHERIALDFPDRVLENLRSLEIFKTLPEGLLMHVRYLRILSLTEVGLEVVPVSIAGLKCLKLLDLWNNPIKVLPECIMGLYNLQSLILYECTLLSELPEGLGNLVNLRHLGLSCYISPTQGAIRELSHLQILPPLELSEGGFQISELECLNNIRGKLKIKGLELIKCKQEAEMANLSMKSRVEELWLEWDDKDSCTNHEEVLEALYPDPSLKVLSIKGYAGETFPSWLIRMNVLNKDRTIELYSLQKIELVDCGRCSQLPTLGNLPNLKLIYISEMDFLKQITPEFYCGADLLLENNIEAASSSSSSLAKSKSYFPRLKEFRLCNLPNLVEWCEPGTGVWTGFQCLEVLVMEDCPRLTKMPNNFPLLQKLTVKSINSDEILSNILSNKTTLTFLKNLHIKKVIGLTHLPETLTQYCTSLEVLKIEICPYLVFLPNLSGLVLLRELEIDNNLCLTSVPEGLQSCYSLENLGLYCCPKVETLPDLTGLTRLSNLSILGMTKMINEAPEWMYNLPRLRILHIGDYFELNEFPDFSFLSKITSLKTLWLYGWEWMQSLSLPTQLQHFTALESLGLYYFKDLECLPDWIQNFSSLRFLVIKNCPLLEENIKPDGTQHHKIAPHVKVIISSE